MVAKDEVDSAIEGVAGGGSVGGSGGGGDAGGGGDVGGGEGHVA